MLVSVAAQIEIVFAEVNWYRWARNGDDSLFSESLHQLQCFIIIMNDVPHEHVREQAQDAKQDEPNIIHAKQKSKTIAGEINEQNTSRN